MNVVQSKDSDILVRLFSGVTPVTGLLNTDISMVVWKSGATTFSSRSVPVADWVEVGNGYYVLKMRAVDFDTLGMMVILLSGGSFDPLEKELTVEPAGVGNLASPSLCIISGNTLDLTGEVLPGKQVVFTPTGAPTIHGSSVVNYKRIITYTDVLGNFSVSLLREAAAIVEIPEAGLRAQITVPDQPTALLLDLLPPTP